MSMMAKQETETSPFQTTSMQLRGQPGKLSKPTPSGIFPTRPNIPRQRHQLGSKCSILGSMGWHSPSNHQTSLLARLIPLNFFSISIFLESLIFLIRIGSLFTSALSFIPSGGQRKSLVRHNNWNTHRFGWNFTMQCHLHIA